MMVDDIAGLSVREREKECWEDKIGGNRSGERLNSLSYEVKEGKKKVLK
jgi:hypothetical protein